MSLTQVLGRRRQVGPLNSRPVWSMKWVLGQPGYTHSETLFQNKQTNTYTKQTSKQTEDSILLHLNSVYSPGWLQQTGDSPASASRVAGLQVFISTPGSVNIWMLVGYLFMWTVCFWALPTVMCRFQKKKKELAGIDLLESVDIPTAMWSQCALFWNLCFHSLGYSFPLSGPWMNRGMLACSTTG